MESKVKQSKKLKIFVTGGNGFIGSHLVDKLIELGHDVASFDANLNFAGDRKYFNRCLYLRQKIFNKPTKIYSGDIRDYNRLKKALKSFRPNVVVHLAGLPMARVHQRFYDDMVTINSHGSHNLIKVFEQSDATRLIYTSSSMVYGHFKQTPQSEDFILTPENLYGATKAAGEYFVKLLNKEWVIIRPTSVYGFTDCANRVTQLLMDAAILKKPAWIIKGETLDFSYITDVVDGFVRSIVSPQAVGHTFNVSKGEGRAASEFAAILKNFFPDFEYEIKEPSNYQVWRGPLDITKAKTILKFDPQYSIEKGIKEILEFMEEQNFYNSKKINRRIAGALT